MKFLIWFSSLLVLARGQATCDHAYETQATNPYAQDCGCANQLWISDDCQQGFVCSGNGNDGCLINCPEGEHVLPDFDRATWRCEKDDSSVSSCPGATHILCKDAADAVDPATYAPEICECEYQVHVNPTCDNVYYCFGAGAEGLNLQCDPGKVVEFDIRSWNLGCKDDSGQCPGPDFGGFRVGCTTGAPRPSGAAKAAGGVAALGAAAVMSLLL